MTGTFAVCGKLMARVLPDKEGGGTVAVPAKVSVSTVTPVAAAKAGLVRVIT